MMTMRTLLLSLALLASLGGCALRATLPPVKGEGRTILWRGVELRGVGGARVDLAPRTTVVATDSPDDKCFVMASGEATITGEVDCGRLGFVAVRPTDVLVKPQGPVRLTVNGDTLLAPKERKGELVRVTGEAHDTFDGWVKASDLGVKSERAWLAPGLTRYPWICEDGGWIFDRPQGTFLTWIPGPWCRVTLLERKDQWARVRYEDQRIRIEGWVEAESLEADREPRFHPGAVARVTKKKMEVFGRWKGQKSFGHIDAGVRIWASTRHEGRTLVQTQGLPNDVVGWVNDKDLD